MTKRQGMTLIELLIVVVILGILAAIMATRTRSMTDEAYLSVMKSDLRSMTVLQEIHHQTDLTYAALDVIGFTESEGVTIDLTWLDRNGYAATATHAGLSGVMCGVFRGSAADGLAGPADVEGEVACQ